MTKQTVFLSLEEIITIHVDQIERYGGSHGIRDLILLESAVFRPQSTFGGEELYSSIFEKAAALTHSIIMNHPFIDGNKRTGMVSSLIFLELNGYNLAVNQKSLVNAALCIATKKWNIEDFINWLKKNSKKIYH